MLLRGHEVELISLPRKGFDWIDDYWAAVDEQPGAFLLDARTGPDYWILNDDDGEHFRSCDVFVLRVRRGSYMDCKEQDIQKAARYYEGTRGFEGFRPIFPGESWERLPDVHAIRYLRGGKGSWRHPFTNPVRCYQAGKSYKLSLPNGCILSDHGFVDP